MFKVEGLFEPVTKEALINGLQLYYMERSIRFPRLNSPQIK
jgi:hypothetical protein